MACGWRSLPRLCVASFVVRLCTAAIYPFTLKITETSSYIYSEGPMFSMVDTPFGNTNSEITVDLKISWDTNAKDGDNPAMFNAIYFDSLNSGAMGYDVDSFGTVVTRSDLCCTKALKQSGACPDIGQVWFPTLPKTIQDLQEANHRRLADKPDVPSIGSDFGGDDTPLANHPVHGGVVEGAVKSDDNEDALLWMLPSVRTLDLEANEDGGPLHFTTTFAVRRSGEQFVALVSCPYDETPEIDVEGTLSFKNPYGFLSGRSIGFLPFYGTLSGMYAILFLVFLFYSIRNCDVLLNLQYCLFAIIILSFVEAIAWFVLYLDLDVSGVPVCCPLHFGATIAVLINVCKRAVSRCLLWAVCLGYGVVLPSLARNSVASILFTGILYAGFAMYNDIRINNDALPAKSDWWGIPVTIVDVYFVVCIYLALTRVHADLKETRQTAKAKMYAQLGRTLATFVVLWVSFALFSILVNKGFIPLTWGWQWVLHSFWHVSYFIILAVICWVWAPSSQSQQYAYSFQLPSSPEEADAYEMNVVYGEDGEDESGDV